MQPEYQDQPLDNRAILCDTVKRLASGKCSVPGGISAAADYTFSRPLQVQGPDSEAGERMVTRRETGDEDLVSAAALGVHLCRAVSTGAIVVMVWRVFAPGRVWSSTLSGILLLGFALVVVGEVREMRPPATTNHPLYWLWTGLMAVSYCWTSWESLRYHAMLKRRMRLGLADPVVANRMLLWGVASGCIAIQTPVILASIVLGGEDHIASWALVVVSVFSCLAAATVWLAFFPPASYLKRIAARAAAAES